MVLEKINAPNDIKSLKKEELPVLADEIRIGETGGYVKEWNINSEKVTLGVEKV